MRDPSLARVCNQCLALQKQKFALTDKASITNWRQRRICACANRFMK